MRKVKKDERALRQEKETIKGTKRKGECKRNERRKSLRNVQRKEEKEEKE